MLQSGALLPEQNRANHLVWHGQREDGRLSSWLAALAFIIGKLPVGASGAWKHRRAGNQGESRRPAGGGFSWGAMPPCGDASASCSMSWLKMEMSMLGGTSDTGCRPARACYGSRSSTSVCSGRGRQPSSHHAAHLPAATLGRATEEHELAHGQSKTPREIELHFGLEAPAPSSGRFPSGYETAGATSERARGRMLVPPARPARLLRFSGLQRHPMELRDALSRVLAAEETLNARGHPLGRWPPGPRNDAVAAATGRGNVVLDRPGGGRCPGLPRWARKLVLTRWRRPCAAPPRPAWTGSFPSLTEPITRAGTESSTRPTGAML